MPVCEGLVGVSLQELFDSFDSPELENFARQCGVEANLIRGMEDKFLEIRPVISDAEAKEFKSKPVKKWLEQLKDVIYDTEDVFDLIKTKSLRFNLKQSDYPSHTDCAPPHQVLDPSTSSKKKKRKKKKKKRRRTSYVTSTEHCFELNDKIKQITKRLEGVARRKKGLRLEEGTPGTSAGGGSIVITEQRWPKSSSEDELNLYGRDTDVAKLYDLLISLESGNSHDDVCNSNVDVIPIVGQGGIGKTTFAQRLYNHKALAMGKPHFDLRAWVCVSDVFDVNRVTKGIIESATSQPCVLTQLPAIYEELKKTLVGKKFLLVLDDVWTDKYEDWIVLSTPFRAGAKGSKVIITTRSDKVFSMPKEVRRHHLKLLSDEDSFKLLKRHASIQNLDAQPALERIGKEIARKCKGLPLAAKALGGVLRSKREEVEWKEILDSDIWALETELNPALWLSYHYLPAPLKRCFVYSGIIPKDYEFDMEELIRLWMAEGLLEQEAKNHKKRMEDIGEEHFRELVSRSFFQQSSEYYSSKFVMHDLINDLARAVSGETCLTMDKEKKWEKLICEKTRHFSHWMEIPKSEAFYRADKLRTYASLETYSSYEKSVYNDPFKFTMKPESLLRLVCLRVLCLNACLMSELPESISNLVHLRYLDLSDTDIETLPESINALCNLQTLLLQRCSVLEELHINTEKLINLRCLDLEGCISLKKMPRGIGRLKELQMLTYFIVDENNDIGIEELTNLEHLRGKLEISGLQAIRDPIHTFKINLRNKQHLHTLELVWKDRARLYLDSEAKSVAEHVLDGLQPHTNLERLTVRRYYGACLPSWLVEWEEQTLPISNKVVEGGLQYQDHPTHQQLFPMLKYIEIGNCWNLGSLPEELFLLPSLEHMEIGSCDSLNSFSRRDSRCSSSTTAIKITKLRRIDIYDCGNLESLPEILHKLTSLESLNIFRCNRLRSLPDQMHRLCCLEELIIHDCPRLLSFPEGGLPTKLCELRINGCPLLKQWCESIKKEDWPSFAEIPHVVIDYEPFYFC